jgi:hypothetical protein
VTPPSSYRNPPPPSLTTGAVASQGAPSLKPPPSPLLRRSGECRPPPLCPEPPLRLPEALREHLTAGKPPHHRRSCRLRCTRRAETAPRAWHRHRGPFAWMGWAGRSWPWVESVRHCSHILNTLFQFKNFRNLFKLQKCVENKLMLRKI